jgi:DNA-binding transcriptional LysR family regulator
VTVVEAGGFRACSDLLDISVAAVSHQIGRLESELGCKLFIRRRGRLCGLTERGASAYAEAKELLGHAATFSTRVEGRKNQFVRHVTILADAILEMHLAKHIAEFASRHPLIDISLKRSYFEEMVDALGKGQADIVYFYSSGPVSALASEYVWAEPISICARRDHPVFSRQRITPRELREFPFVAPPEGTHFRRSVDAVLRKEGLENYKTVIQTAHAHVARESVIGGFAISAVLSRYLADELSQHGVYPVAVFEGRLTLEVRRAIRHGLALDGELSTLLQLLNRAAPPAALRGVDRTFNLLVDAGNRAPSAIQPATVANASRVR